GGVVVAAGIVEERVKSVGGVVTAGQQRASKRSRATPGVVVGVAGVIGCGLPAPARGSAQHEDEAGDDDGTTHYSVHGLLLVSERLRCEDGSHASNSLPPPWLPGDRRADSTLVLRHRQANSGRPRQDDRKEAEASRPPPVDPPGPH